LIVIPLLVLLIYGDSYATKVVRNQVALANTNLVTLNMREIDQNLTEVDKYLYSMAAVETDLQVLDLSNTDQSQNYYMAKIRLDNRLSSNILNFIRFRWPACRLCSVWLLIVEAGGAHF